MWGLLSRWVAGRSSSAAAPRPPRCGLQLESLEAREVPAVTIQLDYSLDASGFFNDPARRAVLQRAANDLASHLDASLPALAPGGGNAWSEILSNPSTGQQVTLSGRSVAANTIVVYVGARDLAGNEAGLGGSGGYSASGSAAWLSGVAHRGPTGSSLWGGSIAFDNNGTNWYFGSAAAGIGASQVDFYSVAVHELGHVLGIGTSQHWSQDVSGGTFRGASADAVYGGAVPVAAGGDHWADGLSAGGVRAAMDPVLRPGARVGFSALDFAALKDIGWTVAGVAAAQTAALPPTAAPATPTASTHTTHTTAIPTPPATGATTAAHPTAASPAPHRTWVTVTIVYRAGGTQLQWFDSSAGWGAIGGPYLLRHR